MELEDFTMDIVMKLYRGNIPPIEEKNIPSFVLLDIDNQTNQSWGEPLYTPRDKLKNLIDVAVQAKARLIVVDVDVSRPEPYDQELKEYLEKHVTECKEKQSACSPIILVRALSKFASGSTPAEPRTGFFDDVVTTESAPYLQWGSAQFSFSAGMVRRWRLWEPACTKEQPEVIPSIELLVMDMIRGCSENIQNALRSLQPQNCNGNGVAAPSSVTFCGLTMSTDHQNVQQRIMYRIPGYDTDASESPKYVVHDNNDVPILTVFSAQPYAESPSQESLEIMTGSIVVIGGSYNLGGANDVHPTPIGDMPGALVVINAIYSVLQEITIKPVSIWLWFAIAVVFIVIITLFSYYFSGRRRILRWGCIFIILGGLLIYSVILFEDGTWLNIAIPLLIIRIYQGIYLKIYQVYQAICQKQWVKKFANNRFIKICQ
jgi:hypothetical protein